MGTVLSLNELLESEALKKCYGCFKGCLSKLRRIENPEQYHMKLI